MILVTEADNAGYPVKGHVPQPPFVMQCSDFTIFIVRIDVAIRDGCWELCHPPVRRFAQTVVQRFTKKRELTMVTSRWFHYGDMVLKWKSHGVERVEKKKGRKKDVKKKNRR